MTGHTPTGGCSRESLAMGESLTKRHFVMDEALRGVNIFYLGRRRVSLLFDTEYRYQYTNVLMIQITQNEISIISMN